MLNIGGISIVEASLILIAIIYSSYNFILTKIKKNREKTGYYLRKNIENSISLRNEIKSIYHSNKSVSVNLLHAHNHDILRPEQPWYVSLLYYYPEENDNTTKSKWKETEIDYHYKNILKQLLKHKILLIETEDFPENSKLKVLYDTLGIHSSLIISLSISNKNFIYLSINFKEVIVQHPEFLRDLMLSRKKIITYLH